MATAAAREAIAHLAAAEKWQHALGAFATGAGEGLACMGAVHEYRIAQAWLHALLAQRERSLGDKQRALALVEQVEGDPNGLSDRHARAIGEIRAFDS